MVGYTRQSAASMITGGTMTAAIFNAEFNQLASAFDATTGHTHSGVAGDAPPIPLATGTSGSLPVNRGGTNASTAADARTNLGLVIGTNVQAYDAGLQSISGLTTAADRMIYTTASDVYAVTPLTSFARTLLDDGGAATARGTLGLGTIATVNSPVPVANGGTGSTTAGDARTALGLAIGTDVQAYDVNTSKLNVAQEYTRTQNFNATTLTDAASISWDLSQNQVSSVTLGGNRTLTNPTNMVDGATYILIVKQDGTGNRTLSYGTAYKWPGGTAPTLTTTTGAVDILTFVSDGTNMYGVITQDFS